MLQQEGNWNDLSPKLIKKLEDEIASFGKKVRFKFDISNPDPDPEKRSANVRIFPFVYTLDPITFNINDKDEDRKDKQKSKKIGVVELTEERNGRMVATKFRRIRIKAAEKGVKEFDLTKDDDVAMVMYLLLHPKLTGGWFADPDRNKVVTRIDEKANAAQERVERSERKKALDAVEEMTDNDMISFADAMQWDSTQDPGILRNEIERLADTQPMFFNDLVKDKKIEYRALVKKAMIQGVISFNPEGNKFTYTSNNQMITIVSVVENEVVGMADWLLAGGAAADAVYKKLKGIVSVVKETA